MKTRLLLVLFCSVFLLNGCGTNGGTTAANKPKDVVINVFNWGDYIDEDTISIFEKETGYKINYETFDSNETMYAKIKSGVTAYDVIFPSEYMVQKMQSEGLLEKIDLANVPNYKNIDKRFTGDDFAVSREYGVPFSWGTLGIVYDKTAAADTVDTWDVLFDEKNKGKIFMYDSMRDSLDIALIRLGFSLNTTDINELEQAKRMLFEQKPLVLAYKADDIKDAMIGGEAAYAVMYSGDAMYVSQENPNLDYAIPKEGSNIWFDLMAIPKGTKHKKEAEEFINYMLEPETGKRVAEYTGYTTANHEAMQLCDAEYRENSIFNPENVDLSKCEAHADLGEFTKEFDRAWTEVLAH